jgi:hypothetical protein
MVPAAMQSDGTLPRTRGDGPLPTSSVARAAAAPPHTRGLSGGTTCRSPARQGFPAHMRGGPSPGGGAFARPATSPHTRGCPCPARHLCRMMAASPHVWMVPCRTAAALDATRLPRTRRDAVEVSLRRCSVRPRRPR